MVSTKINCFCGSSVLPNNMKRHEKSIKHTQFHTNIDNMRNSIPFIPEIFYNKTYSMSINFLTKVVFESIKLKKVKDTQILKNVLKQDCENDTLFYYTEIVYHSNAIYYDEKWFLTNGRYCLKIVSKNISTSSSYNLLRSYMPDKYNDEYYKKKMNEVLEDFKERYKIYQIFKDNKKLFNIVLKQVKTLL